MKKKFSSRNKLFSLIYACLLLSFLGILSSNFLFRNRVIAEEKPSISGITSNPSGNNSPIWSPDGKKIAFVSGRDGNQEIYVMNADGSQQTNLSKNPARDYQPAWSPDGKQIAFVSDRDTDRFNTRIYVMNADGSRQTLLTPKVNHNNYNYFPAWSVDGKKIAFRNELTTYVMNADGSGLIQLQYSYSNPVWSPDGKRILLSNSNCDLSKFNIFSVNADGTGEISLLKGVTKHFLSDLAWSPDGKQISFLSKACKGFSSQLYVMNADGSKLRHLVNTESFSYPTWSPNSKQIAFGSMDNIYIINVGTSKLINITKNRRNSRRSDGSPAWSPNGKKIAFESPTFISNSNIYVINSDGSGTTKLTK